MGKYVRGDTPACVLICPFVMLRRRVCVCRYKALFSRLSPDVVTIFVNALLTETNVLLLASHPQPLTDVFEAAQALVVPYEWQMTYISIIVEEQMIEHQLHGILPCLLGWVKTGEIHNPVDHFPDANYRCVVVSWSASSSPSRWHVVLGVAVLLLLFLVSSFSSLFLSSASLCVAARGCVRTCTCV